MPSNTSESEDTGPGDDTAGERLHIRSIKEMPSGQDDEIAVIFREMRRASEMSLEQLSAKLGAPVQTLQALESGAILALPDWEETRRIITAYTGLMDLDPRPVLRRLEAQLSARGDTGSTPFPEPAVTPPPPPSPSSGPTPSGPESQAGQSAVPDAPQGGQSAAVAAGLPMPPGAKQSPAPHPAAPATPPPEPVRPPDPRAAAVEPAPAPPVQEAPPRTAAEPARKRRRGVAGTIMTWLIILILFAAMGFGVHYASQNPDRIWSMVETLPDPAPRAIRSIWELVRPLEKKAPAPAGGDPRSNKSDRLPSDKAPPAN